MNGAYTITPGGVLAPEWAPKVAWAMDSSGPRRTFPGDTGNADVADLCGNTPAGVRSATGCTWVNGPYGPAIQTDGSAGYVNCGTPSGLNGATQAAYHCLVYKASNSITAAFGGSAGAQTGGNRFSFFWDTDGNGYFPAEANGTNYADGGCAIPLGWNSIFCAFDGTQSGNANRLRVFVNGSQSTLTFSGSSIPSALGNVGPITIGKDSNNRFSAGTYSNCMLMLRLGFSEVPALAAALAADPNRIVGRGPSRSRMIAELMHPRTASNPAALLLAC